jgi:menaquinone-specific isochorismate synthase
MEDPAPQARPGSTRPEPVPPAHRHLPAAPGRPSRTIPGPRRPAAADLSDPVGDAAGRPDRAGDAAAPRLFSRVVRLADGLDPLDLAGEDGFVWRSPAGALVGVGLAARVQVGTGPGRIERAAEAVAALLDAAEVSDPDGTGLGPAAVGALPFHPATPGELVVPALLLRTDPHGRTWAVRTEPFPFAPPSPADLLAHFRATSADPGPTRADPGVTPADSGATPGDPGAAPGDPGWPAARRLDGGLWTAGATPFPVGVASPTGGPGTGPGESHAGSGGFHPSSGGSGGGSGGSGAVADGSDPRWWRGAVRAALAAIGAGRVDKVVLAREAMVEADRPFPRAEVLRRLGRRSGGSTFLYAMGGFVGASPELLVRRHGLVATSRPMAGTVPRGDSAAAEAAGLARLTGSPKEAVEHRLVVDAVAEGLAKVADRVEVGRPEVVRLATVAHLATEITADLTGPVPTALELAGLLHPTPAVGGSPRDAALAEIAALEPFDRGRYAGPVGWVDRAGDGEWAVALRCATLDGRRAHLLAGAGIVPGSDPDAEWAETEDKLRAMLEVLLG